jgi:hypothetical protein
MGIGDVSRYLFDEEFAIAQFSLGADETEDRHTEVVGITGIHVILDPLSDVHTLLKLAKII